MSSQISSEVDSASDSRNDGALEAPDVPMLAGPEDNDETALAWKWLDSKPTNYILTSPDLPQRSSQFPEDDLDWALIPNWTIEDVESGRAIPNTAPSILPLGMVDYFAKPPSTSRPILALTSSKSTVTGTVNATPFFLKVHSTDRFVKTYSIRLDQSIGKWTLRLLSSILMDNSTWRLWDMGD
jgi:hypothetical protein